MQRTWREVLSPNCLGHAKEPKSQTHAKGEEVTVHPMTKILFYAAFCTVCMEGRRVAIGGNCRPVLNPVCSSSRVNVELRGPLVRVQNGLSVFSPPLSFYNTTPSFVTGGSINSCYVCLLLILLGCYLFSYSMVAKEGSFVKQGVKTKSEPTVG